MPSCRWAPLIYMLGRISSSRRPWIATVVMAIQGLNSTILLEDGQLSRTYKDAGTRLTALLATSYALAFAASYMGDSLSFFLVLVRACSSLTIEIVQAGHSSPLLPWNAKSATSAPHLEVMRRRLKNVPPFPGGDIAEAKASLNLVEKECSFAPFQWDLLSTLKLVVDSTHEPFEGRATPDMLGLGRRV